MNNSKSYKRVANEIARICKLAVTQNAENYHVFVDISGHVSKLSVRVSYGGWISHEPTITIIDVYFDNPNNVLVTLQRVLLLMQKVHKLYIEDGIKYDPAEHINTNHS